jgi:hypothetical protein
MATIFNPIDKTIADQIDVRQQIMDGTIRNQHARNTYLNKACVVKLVPLIKDISSPQSTITYDDFIFDNFTLKNNFFNNSTGFGYNDKVEKPFIQNIEITSRSGNNYGATRTGKLTLIIPTKNQFNSIERYFRIGTAFLLEWGWGNYVDKNGESFKVEKIKWVDEKSYLNQDQVSEIVLEDAVLEQRKNNKGNYDGGIFFITNFTTNIQNNTTDYYYELTLNLVSKGDILNSLEPNTPFAIKDPDSESPTSDDRIKNNPLIRLLIDLEYGIEVKNVFSYIEENSPITRDTSNETTTSEEVEDTSQTETIDTSEDSAQNYPELNLSPKNNFIRVQGKRLVTPSYGTASPLIGFATQETQYESFSYIKLRFILNFLYFLDTNNSQFIEQNQPYRLPIYYCTLNSTPSNSIFYKWEWIPYEHFASFNPEKVILPHYPLIRGTTSRNVRNFLINEKIDNNSFKIGGILIRTKFLIDEISNLIKDNKFSFNNIIDLILREINQWTDNELNLIKYDIDGTNQYSIVSLKSTDSFEDNLPTLKLYGIGSTVEQVDIDTVISNELSSQVAIMMNGSTNYKIDPMATSLLKFNTGIKSRLKNFAIGSTTGTPKRNPQGYLNAIKIIHQRNHKFLSEEPISSSPYQDFLDQFRKFKQDYSEAVIENSAYDGIQGTPLFPIKIRTTLPGISGIAIGNKLKIEDIRLPDIYTSNNVYYVVTNQQSKIENKYWQTFLDLSPQINTDVKALSTQGASDPNVVQTPQNPDVILSKLLNVIQKLESKGTKFAEVNGREQGPVWSPANSLSRTNNYPLLSTAGNDSREVKARGPYQLKPDAAYDALQYSSFSNIINVLLTLNNPPIQNTTSKYKWKDTVNFNNVVDTVSSARILARDYITRYQSLLQPKDRTYLRLLSLYKLGTSALYSNSFITRAKPGNPGADREYPGYIEQGRDFLQAEGVPNNELNDNFIQEFILPTLEVLK